MRKFSTIFLSSFVAFGAILGVLAEKTTNPANDSVSNQQKLFSNALAPADACLPETVLFDALQQQIDAAKESDQFFIGCGTIL